MSLERWVSLNTISALSAEFSGLSDRKIQLLTAAYLRRVWKYLTSHHTRIAVEATEKFADGLLTPHQLARIRTFDTVETAESLWLAGTTSWYSSMPLWERELHGDAHERSLLDGEKRIAAYGYVLPHAKAGVEWADWVAAKAAFLARELAPHNLLDPLNNAEASVQFRMFCDIAGDGWPVGPCWRRWRTNTVKLIARGIYRDRAFDQLPILADALQDAGCNDDEILAHCRKEKEHVRGCWVVDLAMGVT